MQKGIDKLNRKNEIRTFQKEVVTHGTWKD